MSNADPQLLNRAAECYQRLDMSAEAARCYREAGSHRQAAKLHERLGHYSEAAADYARAGLPDLAAWLLVHHAGDSAAARKRLALGWQPPSGAAAIPAVTPLRRRLILARCDVAEGRSPATGLAVLADACTELAKYSPLTDQNIELWAVALAEAMDRDDQVALVFAAAVRGRRPGAAQRWRTWSHQVLHTDLVLPPAEPLAADAPVR
ncbi:MAG: hypothetical protein ACRDTG_02885 [Pseudonocardiaceae bacterium]